MIDRIPLDEAYMQMAEVWAQRSYASKAKVAALLVKDNQIISDGFNGMPAGFPNEDIEHWVRAEGCKPELKTDPLGLHAEANAILKCARHGVSSKGATLYTTTSPCLACTKLILQAGITRVVYRVDYRDPTAFSVLARAGISIEKIDGVSL